MTWIETSSKNFEAHHEASESEDARTVLTQLEDLRQRLGQTSLNVPATRVIVVLHPAGALLSLAHPQLLLARQMTSGPGRRYLTGWFTTNELHLLSPRALRERSAGDSSREALALAPSREYARLVVGHNNPSLPPPYRVATVRAHWHHAWLMEGAAQHLSGQTPHLAAAIKLRLREDQPSFPPTRGDATLLAGTVFDFLIERSQPGSALDLIRSPAQNAEAELLSALRMSKNTARESWRAYLETSCVIPRP